jgi:YegS/Rv2252/BmrU family lipid kinase
VLAVLSERGFELVRPPLPATRDSVRKIIRQHAHEVDLVIAAGGDGTLNSTLQGIIGTDLPLGIVPLGTANDLCKTLGIPADPVAACDVIAGGHVRRIDVGCVNGTYYFNEASIGLSVALSRRLTSQNKSRFGVLAHLLGALSMMPRLRRFRAIIKADDDREVAVHAAQLTVGNSGNFGGVLQSDEASIDDRRLDLYSIEFRYWWNYFEALLSLVRRRYDDAQTVLTRHARRFEVRTGRPMSIEADGEIVSKTPALFEVVPLAIGVFAPEAVPA